MIDQLPHLRSDDAPGKALILRAGLDLFARKGLAETSIRDIAAEAGLTNPALYKHFKSKEDLAVELFERIYRQHMAKLAAATEGHAGFAERFRAFLTVRLTAIDQSPDASIFAADNLVALWPLASDALKRRTILSLLREMLEAGRAQGQVSARAPVDLQCALVVGALEHITRQTYFGVLTRPVSVHLDEVERMLRAGLR